MPDRGWMEPIVERVVTQVLESHSAQLRSEIVRRVLEELAAHPAEEPATTASDTAELARAVAEIQMGGSQKEILKALLDCCGRYATRVALFVVKAGNASGWQGRGFASDAIKDFKLDSHAPAVSRAIIDREIVETSTADSDSHFLTEFGAPASGKGHYLPLVLKDKVAALVYADGGTESGGQVDPGCLELLVLSTRAWLEVSTLRKQTQPQPSESRAESAPAPVAAAQQFNDPFAGHTPAYAMAAAATSNSTAVMSAPEPEVVEDLPAPPAPVEAEPAPAAGLSPEDQETHKKAQRFARLLVDEVKLYNQAKVAEGRKHKDLYDRLKEAIEKSRGTYQKRYGNTVAASGDYFQHELVRSLAEDDVSIMGANFKH